MRIIKIILLISLILILSLSYHSFFVYGEVVNKMGLVVDGVKSVNLLYNEGITSREVDSKHITSDYMKELYYIITILSYDNMGIQTIGRDLEMFPPPKHIRDGAVEEAESLVGLLISESDRKTVIEIDKYLRNAVVYVDGAPNAHDSYGALIDGKAVCEGYARAFKLLCDKMGIPALVMVGEADFGLAPRKLFGADLVIDNMNLNHAWNIVYIDGEWYHFDSTWNDNLGESRYTFLTEKEIRKDHNFDTKYLDEVIALLYGEDVKTYSGVTINTKGYEIKEKGFKLSNINSIEDMPTWGWFIIIGLVFNILLFIIRKK